MTSLSEKVVPLYSAVATQENSSQEDVCCQVIISCAPQGTDGNLEVKLEYSGDPVVAAFLLDQAKMVLEDQ